MILPTPELIASLQTEVRILPLSGNVPGSRYREAFTDFDGQQTTVGAFIVNLVLSGCAAYRTQLFLYLKASGQPSLNSMNLWSGVDAAPAA